MTGSNDKQIKAMARSGLHSTTIFLLYFLNDLSEKGDMFADFIDKTQIPAKQEFEKMSGVGIVMKRAYES
jgi:hypothetical protein